MTLLNDLGHDAIHTSSNGNRTTDRAIALVADHELFVVRMAEIVETSTLNRHVELRHSAVIAHAPPGA